MNSSLILWIFAIISVIITVNILWQQSLQDGSEFHEIDEQQDEQMNVNGYVYADSLEPTGGVCGKYGCNYYVDKGLCSGCDKDYHYGSGRKKCPVHLTKTINSATRPKCEYCFKHYSEWQNCAPTLKFELITNGVQSSQEAEAYCVEHYKDGHVAAFHNDKTIIAALGDFKGHVWNGFNVETNKWFDGTEVADNDWNSHFFKHYADQRCSYIHSVHNGDLINTLACDVSQSIAFICQYQDK